jgi:hypothetical protein
MNTIECLHVCIPSPKDYITISENSNRININEIEKISIDMGRRNVELVFWLSTTVVMLIPVFYKGAIETSPIECNVSGKFYNTKTNTIISFPCEIILVAYNSQRHAYMVKCKIDISPIIKEVKLQDFKNLKKEDSQFKFIEVE